MRTQVVIVGAGPAGLLLSQLLHLGGVDAVVLEHRDRVYVENRIRAGVLEQETVRLVERAGAGARMRQEGLVHTGVKLVLNGEDFRLDFSELVAASILVYGQTELTKDLIAIAIARGTGPIFEAECTRLQDIESDTPSVVYTMGGRSHRIDCDFIAGCDGQHGICRSFMDTLDVQTFERLYPFGWLGIMADVPPCDDELIYASHDRGFALASQRTRQRSRYYLQVGNEERLEDWPDARIWDELETRLGSKHSGSLTRGPSIDKSIAPLRSTVTEPLRRGRLFLVGDAGHIVPPTGAKGLNLAAADAGRLADGLIAHYRGDDLRLLENYSASVLRHVWRAERFSWWFTHLTHRFADAGPFDRRIQAAEFDQLRRSRSAQTLFAENYVGIGRE
jgi:p-hydroxybenzoate 3-monooxygenase